MTTYKYRAQAEDGKSYTGVVEAYDEYAAIEKLRRTYPIIEQLAPVKEKSGTSLRFNEPLWVSDRTLSVVASQFAIMLRAGLPMHRVVELIAAQTGDRLMKRILLACAADVAAGYSLARSLEKNERNPVLWSTASSGSRATTTVPTRCGPRCVPP